MGVIYLKKTTKPESKEVFDWINSNTSGFVSFSHELLKSSNDEDLFIEYVAYKNKLHADGKKIYNTYSSIISDKLNIKNLDEFI